MRALVHKQKYRAYSRQLDPTAGQAQLQSHSLQPRQYGSSALASRLLSHFNLIVIRNSL